MQFNWSPGIGDPTIGGWLTVLLYLSASFSCWKTARTVTSLTTQGSQERYAWRAISALLLALGINKQLDLQSAVTEIGRILALSEGWYGQRQNVQLAFIVFIATICLAAVVILLVWARRAPAATWFALIGAAFVLGFVLIRAASFHHVDRFIGGRVLSFRWNWILEMGGISLVLIASEWRRKTNNWSGQR